MLFLLILIFIIIILIDVPRLIKHQMYRELVAFSVLFVIGAVYSLGTFYHWPLPNPVAGLIALLRFNL